MTTDYEENHGTDGMATTPGDLGPASRRAVMLRWLRRAWRDQVYLHERLFASQRPWQEDPTRH